MSQNAELLLPLKGGLTLHASIVQDDVLQFALLRTPKLRPISKSALGAAVSITMANPKDCAIERNGPIAVLRVGSYALYLLPLGCTQQVQDFLASMQSIDAS